MEFPGLDEREGSQYAGKGDGHRSILHPKMKIITVFGSSRPVPGDQSYEDAFALGAALARNGYTVCNGGYGGTMEAGAKGARSAGGQTLGITCSLFDRAPNAWITEVVRTDSLEDRLKTLVTRGTGFIVLPGGTGTLLELAYVLESMNKGFIQKRPVVLYGDFWTPVLEPLKQEMRDDGLGDLREVLFIAATPEAAVSNLR